MVARGTSGTKIKFTSNAASPAPGDWGYILFRTDSIDASFDASGNYLAGSILEYCIVEYGGGAQIEYNGAVRMNMAHPFIHHCEIRDNRASGINDVDANSTLKIENNLIENNHPDPTVSRKGGGLYIETLDESNVTILNNWIRNNIGDSNGGGHLLPR